MFDGTADTSNCQCGTCRIPALEEVANRPIAHHVLDALLAAGVERLVMAGTADVLLDIRLGIGGYLGTQASVEYAVCPDGSDIVGALRAAAPFVGGASCVVHLGDGLLAEPLARYLDLARDDSLDLLLLGPEGSEAELPEGVRWRSSRLPDSRPFFCDAGIAVLGPGTLQRACCAEPRTNELRLNALADQLATEGNHIQRHLAQWRRYRGNPSDLLEINRLALDLMVPKLSRANGYRNRIEGRAYIDETASVSASVIVGPVVVGPGAEVIDSYIGPYTSIGAGARIEGSEIERSIISPGASVVHVGGRLVSSLVGPGARVFREFSLPRAMRLRVGRGDEVVLC